MADRPYIYNYVDSRLYLKDMLEFRTKDHSRPETRFEISKYAGLKDPGYLQKIVQGKRNISRSTAKALAYALNLRHQELQFFVELAEFTQAKSFEGKRQKFEILKSFRHFREAKRDIAAQFKFFSRWYYAAILAGLQHPSWRKLSLREQASRFHLSLSDYKKALDELKDLQMLVKVKKEWKPSQPSFRSPREIQSLCAAHFHDEMIQKARQALHELPSNERKLSSITIAVSEEKFKLAGDRLQKFVEDLQVILDSGDTEATKICQLNIQLFPLMRI